MARCRSSAWLVLALGLLLPLSSCANSSLGDSLERSLAADPQLTGASSSPQSSPVVTTSPVPSPDATRSPGSGSGLADLNQLSGQADLSASGQLGAGSETPAPIVSGQSGFTDLDKAPQELRAQVGAVAQLGVLTPVTTKAKTGTTGDATKFEPNKQISRRDFARWLVAANNRFYPDRPTNQIRLASETAQPTFQDVPRTDPDFAVIQGLAEAGIIPSPLSGDSTTVTFRPDAPLTRETLVTWKVPLDTRQPLPAATIAAITETWGFQDATKIDAKALRSVLADFQNGDLANIRRVYGFTTLFQPKKAVSRAEAAATLWYFGYQGEGRSAIDVLKPPPAPTATASPAASPLATPTESPTP